jgi:hypothetical protein
VSPEDAPQPMRAWLRDAKGGLHQWRTVDSHLFSCGDSVIMAECACGVRGVAWFLHPAGCGRAAHERNRVVPDLDSFHRALLGAYHTKDLGALIKEGYATDSLGYLADPGSIYN